MIEYAFETTISSTNSKTTPGLLSNSLGHFFFFNRLNPISGFFFRLIQLRLLGRVRLVSGAGLGPLRRELVVVGVGQLRMRRFAENRICSSASFQLSPKQKKLCIIILISVSVSWLSCSYCKLESCFAKTRKMCLKNLFRRILEEGRAKLV